MARILLGYGDFEGHGLSEVSDEILDELSRRFPLTVANYDYSDGKSLLITIAIHEEVHRRRRSGAGRAKRVSTRKEMAKELVASGYRNLSKTYHPDKDGTVEAQRMLVEVRDSLVKACEGIAEDNYDAIIIWAPDVEISDADIPF
jgi:hypothetical protein